MLLFIHCALAEDGGLAASPPPSPPPVVAAAIAGAGGVPEPFGPLAATGASVRLEGWATRLPEAAAHALVRRPPPALAEAGWTTFVLDDLFGRGPDVVAFLPTRDPFTVVGAVGTDGINYGWDNAAVIDFLRRVAAIEPFEVTGAGYDFVSGWFTTPIENPGKLARMFYKACPDIVWQGTGTLAALRAEIVESGELYCRWD